MIQKKDYLKFTLLLTSFIVTTGCETGVRNKNTLPLHTAESGIIDKPTRYVASKSSSYKRQKSNYSGKIFSNSGTPGYYLQVGVFKEQAPNLAFKNRLNKTSLPHTILKKSGSHYALVGPYKSYNQAKSHVSNVKSNLNINSFVVQILRP